MQALVTGAGGFIGSFLSKALKEKGYDVKGLLLPGEDASACERAGLKVLRGDLTRPETLRGITDQVDIVFHLAARVADWGSKQSFRSIMVDGTRHLLEASKGRIRRFVYFSSIAALGLNRDLLGLSEDAERMVTGIPYCDTKIEAEDLVTDFCRRNQMPYTIIRPANVIGPGSAWIRDVLDGFLRGPFPLIAGGKAPGAFVYIQNLVDGVILAAESEKALGRTYHFRDDYPITWCDYLQTVSGWIGRRPSGRVPFRLAWTMGALLETILTPLGIRPPVTRLAAGVMGKNNDVDNRRAKTELGWESRIPLETAMAEIEHWVQTSYRPPTVGAVKDFHNKIVFITGGSSGIGIAVARLLAQKGAHITIFARDAHKLENARRIIEQSRRGRHQIVTAIPLDVADIADVDRKLQQAVAQAGEPDILINSAGIIAADYFENIPCETFDAVMKTNVYGARNVIAALLPTMKKRRAGQIVNVASAAGLMGMFGYTAYGTSKFALVGFSECLRAELKPLGIAVAVVCPPEVKTPMIREEAKTIPAEARAVKSMAGSLDPEYVARIIVKGIQRKQFLIIPGRMVRLLYLFQRLEGGCMSRATADWVARRAAGRSTVSK